MLFISCHRFRMITALWLVTIASITILLRLVSGAAFPTKRTEDSAYWLQNAKTNLMQVLRQLHGIGNSRSIMAKNVIIFVGDGMGMSTITASRIYKGQSERGASGEEGSLTFETFPHIGLAKTYNVDKQVPDSAGTATALFSAVKTNYGVLSIDATANHTSGSNFRLSTIIDWALATNRRTGFVTTTRVTHATPAALYAHSPNRDWECDSMVPESIRDLVPDIARQLVEKTPGKLFNVIMGGGRYMMGGVRETPMSNGGAKQKLGGKFEQYCMRHDGRNLIDEWLDTNFGGNRVYVKNTAQLLAADTENIDHLLGLFADNHMSYNSFRNQGPAGEPSLAEMTRQAINVLNRPESVGFVLMVEGGRIDQAHHQNYAQLALQEVLEMDRAIQVAMNLTSRQDTLIIVTADHSHAMTLNGYPQRGNNILGFGNKADVTQYETLTYANGPGFWSHPVNVTNDVDGNVVVRVKGLNNETERESPLYQHQAMIPLPDETHAGEDVPVYAIGPGATLIAGLFEQNYVGYVMSYAGCMGPARHLNKACDSYKEDGQHRSSAIAMAHSTELYVLAFLFLIIHYSMCVVCRYNL